MTHRSFSKSKQLQRTYMSILKRKNRNYLLNKCMTILNQLQFTPKLFWRVFLLKKSMCAISYLSTWFDYAFILYNAPNQPSIQVNPKPTHCRFVFDSIILHAILKLQSENSQDVENTKVDFFKQILNVLAIHSNPYSIAI
jgi:hypothetical protein